MAKQAGLERRLLFSVGLGDCEVQTFASGGPGGQHQNKTASGVRLIHHPSGARAESREHRSQIQNKREAFLRMVKTSKFTAWRKMECARRSGQPSIEQMVETAMQPNNLRVEVRDENGKWAVTK